MDSKKKKDDSTTNRSTASEMTSTKATSQLTSTTTSRTGIRKATSEQGSGMKKATSGRGMSKTARDRGSSRGRPKALVLGDVDDHSYKLSKGALVAINDPLGKMAGQGKKESCGKPDAVHLELPNSVLIDLYGVLVPWHYVTVTLPEFFSKHYEHYVREQWNTRDIQQAWDKLVKEYEILKSKGEDLPEVKVEASQEEVIQSYIDNIKWRLDNKKKSQAASALMEVVWTWGYKTDILKVPLYPDALRLLKNWRGQHHIKIYVYASGPKDSMRLFFQKTTEGDVTRWIANYLDASGEAKRMPEKYEVIAIGLRDKPQNLLWITDHPKEASAGMQAKFHTFLVIKKETLEVQRPKTMRWEENEIQGMNIIYSLDQIHFVDPVGSYYCFDD